MKKVKFNCDKARAHNQDEGRVFKLAFDIMMYRISTMLSCFENH